MIVLGSGDVYMMPCTKLFSRPEQLSSLKTMGIYLSTNVFHLAIPLLFEPRSRGNVKMLDQPPWGPKSGRTKPMWMIDPV